MNLRRTSLLCFFVEQPITDDLAGVWRRSSVTSSGRNPAEPEFHLFSLDVASAGYTIFGAEHSALAWDPSQGLRQLGIE